MLHQFSSPEPLSARTAQSQLEFRGGKPWQTLLETACASELSAHKSVRGLTRQFLGFFKFFLRGPDTTTHLAVEVSVNSKPVSKRGTYAMSEDDTEPSIIATAVKSI